jgi:hypothetical protein
MSEKRVKCSDCRWRIPRQNGHAELCNNPKTFVDVQGRKYRQLTASARWTAPGIDSHCGKVARYFEPRPGVTPYPISTKEV